jgi:hypothetical protein
MVRIVDLCVELGVDRDFLWYHAKTGRIPSGGHLGSKRVFTEAQADEIRQYVAQYKTFKNMEKN